MIALVDGPLQAGSCLPAGLSVCLSHTCLSMACCSLMHVCRVMRTSVLLFLSPRPVEFWCRCTPKLQACAYTYCTSPAYGISPEFLYSDQSSPLQCTMQPKLRACAYAYCSPTAHTNTFLYSDRSSPMHRTLHMKPLQCLHVSCRRSGLRL